jgi:orotidine-5'-phosphate decarboxylase
VLPSASRELMGAGPDPVGIRSKAEKVLAQMRAALPVR